MEAQLPIALILMHVELPEDLGCVQEVGVVDDSRDVLVAILWMGRGRGRVRGTGKGKGETYLLTFHANSGRFRMSATQ
jgi:hypothetical protein